MNPFSLSEIFKQTLINFFQKFLTNILSQLLQTYYSRKFRQWHSILLTTSILRLSSIVGWNWAGWLQGVSRRLLLSGQLYYLYRNCLSLRSLLSQRHDLWPWISLSPRDVQLSSRSTQCRGAYVPWKEGRSYIIIMINSAVVCLLKTRSNGVKQLTGIFRHTWVMHTVSILLIYLIIT